MTVSKEQKEELVKKYGQGPKDSGSPQVQVAILTERIRDLTRHLVDNPKDFATRRGLSMLVGKRRSLLNFYKDNSSIEEYKELLTNLELPK